MIRILFLLCCFAIVVSAQQLRVKSADARSVQLEWSGISGSATIERTAGSATEKIGSSEQGSYEDKTISRFDTYRYRVLSGAAKTNFVTVGPPPGGVSNAAPTPKGRDAGKYGSNSAMALDENGDPVIAFEWMDPNGDNDASDNEVDFVRWSRAAYKWLPPVKVQVVGEITSQNVEPISMACDRKSGALAVITAVKEKGAVILVSKDGGATWKGSPLAGITGTVNSTSMAIADGKLHAIVNGDDSGMRYLSGVVDDATSWKNEAVPASAGWKQAANVNVALSIDASGKPVMSWFEGPAEGEGGRYRVWRPGSDPATAVETKAQTDSPTVAIASGGGKIGLLAVVVLDEKDSDHGVWYTQSSDGTAWSKPSKLPVDGPRTTNGPLSVALDSRGGIVGVFGSNGGSATTTCNFPALSRSVDGSSWKTCGPGKAEGADFGPQPPTLHVIEAENDKAYVLWQEQGENKYGQGMLVWHER